MSKITKFLLLAVALTAHIALCEEKKNVSSLEFVNGTCRFLGRTIKHGGYEYPSDICEEWKCNAKTKRLIVTGCYIPPRYGSCFHLTREGIDWPWCCNFYQTYC
uniref:Single domain-containing protein n=1 Tax=Amblyomma americanum TaxID=6943 RepID=A0A0C9RVV6_AMBAM